MQTFSSFKQARQLGSINFYPSKQRSGRFVGSGNGITLVTTKDFDPKKPTFVSDDPNGDEKLFFLTNKQSSVAAFEL